jgi:pimeloyl-ACP methyl ester carboxylesterase
MKHPSAVDALCRWRSSRIVRDLDRMRHVARHMIGRGAGGQARPVALLVHGAWHGAWAWANVERELTTRGWVVHTIDLHSVAERGSPRSGLYHDAWAVRQRIEEIGVPVVVVAHSYGGAVVTQGTDNLPNVRHIVYVCAFALDVGESILGLAGTKPDWWIVEGETMTPDNPRAVFYHDVEQQEADRATARLLPFSYVAVIQTLTAAAWRSVSSTYIICDYDAAIGAAQELLAKRATHTRHLPSSHSPMMCMPSDLTDLIVEALNAPQASRYSI